MRVAFIGLGTMGQGMARNLLKAGFDLTVHNRTRQREEALAALGAKRAASPAEAAREAEVVVTCVSDTPDVAEVLVGAGGVLHGARPGTVVVDCSTISPQATVEMAATLQAKGIALLDAPVSGGSEGAEKGTLAIMVGGEAAALEKARPALAAMGKSVTHVGPSGAGQYTKAVNQIIVGGCYQAVAEGIAFGLKAGLDMRRVVEAIRGGSAGSWVLEFRAANMIDNTYPLGFKVSLHRKDMGIALDAARRLGVSLPMAALVAQVENGLCARGNGDEDLSALCRTIREESGIK